jgi:hypothetical protein
MERVKPSFQYELLVFTPKLETSDEEKKRGNTDGAGPSGTKTEEVEPTNLKGGKDSPHKLVV